MFHVKHHRWPSTGGEPGAGASWVVRWNLGDVWVRRSGDMPREARDSNGQGVASGEALTMSSPPKRSRGAAVSMTRENGPRLRAVTRSARPRKSSSCPRLWTLPWKTATRSDHPRLAQCSSRNAALGREDSTSVHCERGQAAARTNAGRPPPLPRSTATDGTADATSANPSEWSMC